MNCPEIGSILIAGHCVAPWVMIVGLISAVCLVLNFIDKGHKRKMATGK